MSLFSLIPRQSGNETRVAHSGEGPRDVPVHSEPAPEVGPDVSKIGLLRREGEEDIITGSHGELYVVPYPPSCVSHVG